MIEKLAPFAILGASTLLGGCMCEERVVYARTVPDRSVEEIVEVSPGPGSVYVSGHWEWNGARYAWVRAHYMKRPAPGLVWVAAHWQDTPKGWYWQEGHWAQPHVVRPPRLYRPAPTQPVQPAPETEPGEGGMQTNPNVPPAPTYAPPPPPATIPPPPGGAVVPQHYLRGPVPSTGY